jgi:type IV pilus assembly protein PilM
MNGRRPALGRQPPMPKKRASSRSIVGLDIEPGHIAAAQVRAGGGLNLERAASAALAPGVVRDGEFADVEALADALRALFSAHKLPKRVRLGVANQKIVVRTVHLPPLEDPKEIEAAIRFQAQEHIPMPLDQAVLEHQLLGTVDTPDGPRSLVLLVAARRDMIARVIAAAKGAGLRPEGVDLSAFAMIRALQAEQGADGTVLYLSVGGMVNLALADAGRCLFTRVVPGGTELLAQELAERRGLTLEHAHGWLAHTGLDDDPDALDGDPAIVSEARSVLADGVRRIGDEVRNSLDFYRMQDAGTAVDRAVLTGPAVSIPGFADAIGREIGVAVSRGVASGAVEGVEPGRLVVAAGLAVEGAQA